MNDINYTLAYDISTKLSTSIDYFPIFGNLFLAFIIYLVFFDKVEDRRVLIGAFFVIFSFALFNGIKGSMEQRNNNLEILREIKYKHYNIVEGEIKNYIPHDSYNRKNSHFELQGVGFGADYSGFDSYYGYPLKLREGRRLKIFYKMKDYRMIYKIWVENEHLTANTYLYRAVKHMDRNNTEEARKDLLKILEYDLPLYTYRIADFYRQGVIFDKDITRALELYKKACKGGEKKACEWYEDLKKL